MTLIELQLILDYVKRNDPNSEDFDFGPSYGFECERRKEIIKILGREILKVKAESK